MFIRNRVEGPQASTLYARPLVRILDRPLQEEEEEVPAREHHRRWMKEDSDYDYDLRQAWKN